MTNLEDSSLRCSKQFTAAMAPATVVHKKAVKEQGLVLLILNDCGPYVAHAWINEEHKKHFGNSAGVVCCGLVWFGFGVAWLDGVDW